MLRYGGPEGSNTNKKETANKKKKTQIKKIENANEKKETQIKKHNTNKKAQRKLKRKTEVKSKMEVYRKHEGPEFSQATMFNVFDTVAMDSREVKPGFHMIAMIATIAVITAIAEKKKV